MRKFYLLLSLLLLIPPCFSQESIPTGKKRIAVIPFDSQLVGTANLGKIVSEMFVTSLVQLGCFDVIERNKLNEIMQEIKLGEGGMVDLSTAVKAGKLLGVDYILTGTITEFGIREEKKGGILGFFKNLFGGGAQKVSIARVKFDYRIIDVATGKIFFADTGEGEEKQSSLSVGVGTDLNKWIAGVGTESKEWEESSFAKATRKAVRNAIGKFSFLFSPQGKILAREKKTVIMDIGAQAGIKVGMVLEVYRVHPIKDEGGNIVWVDKTKIGEVKITEVREDKAKGEILSESLNIRKDDVVSLPSLKP
jgi:curli biogenesis system outer membrane secretion channel CsgG